MLNFKENASIYFDTLSIIVLAPLAVLLPYTIFGIYKAIKNKDKYIYFILVYGIGMTTVAYPLLEQRHIIYGCEIIMICSLYSLQGRNKKIWLDKFVASLVITIIALVYMFMMIGLVNSIRNNRDAYVYGTDNPMYEGTISSDKDIKKIVCDVIEYINEYKSEHGESDKIVIYSAYSSEILPDENYYKYYDVPCRGNQGGRTLEEQAYDLLSWDNTILIVESIDNCQEIVQLSQGAFQILEENSTLIADLGHHRTYRSNIAKHDNKDR